MDYLVGLWFLTGRRITAPLPHGEGGGHLDIWAGTLVVTVPGDYYWHLVFDNQQCSTSYNKWEWKACPLSAWEADSGRGLSLQVIFWSEGNTDYSVARKTGEEIEQWSVLYQAGCYWRQPEHHSTEKTVRASIQHRSPRLSHHKGERDGYQHTGFHPHWELP